MPRLCEFYPGICLTTVEKARINLSGELSVDVIDTGAAEWGAVGVNIVLVPSYDDSVASLTFRHHASYI